MFGTRAKDAHLKVMVDALLMAAPWCLAARYSFRPWARCIEASNAGAEVLRRKDIDAKLLPCSVAAISGDGGPCMAIGHSNESLYAFLQKRVAMEYLPPYEEWVKKILQIDGRVTEEEKTYPFHLAIEAHYQGRRAVVDLSAGQVKVASNGTIRVPFGMAWYGEDWETTQLEDGGLIAYEPCPHPEHVPPEVLTYQIPGLCSDLEDLMQVAILSNLDPLLFQARLGPLARYDSIIKLEGVSDWEDHERTGT